MTEKDRLLHIVGKVGKVQTEKPVPVVTESSVNSVKETTSANESDIC